MDSTKADGLTATDGGTDGEALRAAWDANQRAQQARSGMQIGGSVCLGLSGAGLVVTIVSGAGAKKAIANVGPWDPDGIE